MSDVAHLSRRLTRRHALAGLGLLAATPWLARLGFVGIAHADDTAAVQAPIKALYVGLIAAMKAGGSFNARFQQLTPIVKAAFDLPTILRVSVGPRWEQLSADDQAKLATAFDRFTIATYASNFDSYNGQKFEIMPDLRAIGADQVVSSRIVPASGKEARIDYLMRNESGSWKAVDVLLDGTISRVAVQRSDFRSLLGQGGAEALIASLNHKTADLAGGTLPS